MGSEPAGTNAPLLRTPLYDLHVAAGAKMVPFAGYEMPVQYPMGVLKEHLWTREKAGLFDVSHMGQAWLTADDLTYGTVAAFLETLVPADLVNLRPRQQRYSQLLNEHGGILDDLMVTHFGLAEADQDLVDQLVAKGASPGFQSLAYLVVNASRKEADFALIESNLPDGLKLRRDNSRSLIALQGPKAVGVLAKLAPEVEQLEFMASATVRAINITFGVSRSGYTGEDGFELSVTSDKAAKLWSRLMEDPDVAPVGLGARDSLRLEAGLCLYGHDIDEVTSPIEAGLAWSIQKRRRLEGGFPGAARIQRDLTNGPSRRRVGIKPEGRAPAREGAVIQSIGGQTIGIVTSGGFGPTVNGPIAMGYVDATHAVPGTQLTLIVRDKPLAARVVELPFVPNRFYRKPKV
jgi:aminomethyltransferase